MKGDFSRNSFRPAKHYSGVRQQQGRVQLDADWNEQMDIRTHLARTHRRDVIGLAAVPHSDGNFRISVGEYSDDFIIDPGRIYIDGILCELEESPIPITEFDPADNKVIQVAAAKDEPSLQAGEQVRLTAGGVTTAVECRNATVGNENRVTLDQDVSALSGGGNPILRRRTTYRHQPDYQVPSDGIATGTYLAYLDVWERHVTAIEDPTIREVALGGPDTATRTKTVWQVKLVNLENSAELESLGLSEHDKWDGNAHPDRGMLTARCQAPQSTDQIYSLKSGGGYQGPENQLYRVEIHAGGQLGSGSANRPTFKWSRDNGSVVTRWLAQDKDLLTVESTGLDENFTFAKGQWIELTDDTLDLQGRRGVLFQIKEVAAQTIIIDPATKDDPNGVISGATWYDCFGPHRKIRRWDFTAWADMAIPAIDGATGDGWVTLENGIEVKFEPGSYRTGDYWLIAARRSEANIIWPADVNDHPRPQPPAGIEHHYAPLAKLDYATGVYQVIRDYRRVLRPLTDPQLEYLSGDGQEAKPGDRLPQPLRVGVFSGLQPVPEAQVHFEIDGGGGTLLPEPAADAPGQTSLTLSPDAAGEVSCCWTLPEFYGAESEQEERRTGQRVKATLMDEADRPLDDLPVYFTATLSLAEHVAYEPRGRGGLDIDPIKDLNALTTVQRGLDCLDNLKVNKYGDAIEGSLSITEDLLIEGNLSVTGDVLVRDVSEMIGDILLGDQDHDKITVHGILKSSHSSGMLEVDDDLHIKANLTVGDTVGGKRSLRMYTTRQDNVLQFNDATGDDTRWELRDDHGDLKINAGNNTANRVTFHSDGNVGIGTGEPAEKLHIAGGGLRVEGPCTVGGDLRVEGDTTLYTERLQVAGNRIHLNHYTLDARAPRRLAIDAGLEIYRGGIDPAKLIWDEGDGYWKIGVGDKLTPIATIDRLPSGVARVIEQADHGFQPGDASCYSTDGPGYIKANSSSETTTGMFVVSQVGRDEEGEENANCFTLVQAGYIDGLSGLTPGEYYYVSADRDGYLTAEEPAGISNPLLYAVSEEAGYVLPYRPSEALRHRWGPLRVIGTDPQAPENAIHVDDSGNVGIGTGQPEAALHVIGKLLGAAQDEAGNAARIRCGQTPEGNTDWKQYAGGAGIYVDVDTSACGFKSTPIYLVNMHGNNNNWSTTGGSSAYSRTPTGFRIYVRWAGGGALGPDQANSLGWHIQWVAIGN